MANVTETNRKPSADVDDLTASLISATDAINTADISAASTGDALKKAASGSDLEFGEVGSDLKWTKDANSPFEINNSQSGTFTLSDTYKLVFIVTKSSSGFRLLNMRLNGDTGSNYSYLDGGGTRTTAASSIVRVCNTGYGPGVNFFISGEWSNVAGVSISQTDPESNMAHVGRNNNITSPLNSITLFESDQDTNISYTAEVYGLK